jgi:hypothetical protein
VRPRSALLVLYRLSRERPATNAPASHSLAPSPSCDQPSQLLSFSSAIAKLHTRSLHFRPHTRLGPPLLHIFLRVHCVTRHSQHLLYFCEYTGNPAPSISPPTKHVSCPAIGTMLSAAVVQQSHNETFHSSLLPLSLSAHGPKKSTLHNLPVSQRRQICNKVPTARASCNHFR